MNNEQYKNDKEEFDRMDQSQEFFKQERYEQSSKDWYKQINVKNPMVEVIGCILRAEINRKYNNYHKLVI